MLCRSSGKAISVRCYNGDVICYTFDNLGKVGRLGNQLFQIAGTIGLAYKNGAEAKIRPDWEYREFFNIPDHFYGKPSEGAEVIDGGDQYFQEFHYFSHIRERIWLWFQPSALAWEALSASHPEFFSPNKHLTAIHVRRGDYVTNQRYFPVMPSSYYNRAIGHVRQAHPDTEFIVFSDDPEWCRANFDADFKVVGGQTEHPDPKHRLGKRPGDMVDLFLMAECDQHIISNSTYSWWGAYLSANEAPVYPSRWFGPGFQSNPKTRIPWELMMPDRWIKVDAD